MNRFQRSLGKVCDNCPLCNYARKNSESGLGRIMSWHGQYCPAWQAQQKIAAAREEEGDQTSEVGGRRSDDTVNIKSEILSTKHEANPNDQN